MTTTRRIHGLPDLLRSEVDGRPGWRVVVSKEPWLIGQRTATSAWQGTTQDGRASTPRLRSLEGVVRWIIRHERQWQASLKAQRPRNSV